MFGELLHVKVAERSWFSTWEQNCNDFSRLVNWDKPTIDNGVLHEEES